MIYNRSARNDKSVTFGCVHKCFCFVSWSVLARKNVQSYENDNFLNILNNFGLFPQVFGQVNE